VLLELGIESGQRVMLVAAPDSVLAEASRLSPRPSFAPGIMTAEPADILAWWPERETFTAAAIGRLRWFLEMSGGSAWVVLEPADDAPEPEDARRELEANDLKVDGERQVGSATALVVRL
jgi:hypothetical protein